MNILWIAMCIANASVNVVVRVVKTLATVIFTWDDRRIACTCSLMFHNSAGREGNSASLFQNTANDVEPDEQPWGLGR